MTMTSLVFHWWESPDAPRAARSASWWLISITVISFSMKIDWKVREIGTYHPQKRGL